jgi:hypothetical protein
MKIEVRVRGTNVNGLALTHHDFTDGRALYTPESFQDKIRALNLKVGQRFIVEKRRQGRELEWHADLLPDHGGGSPAAALLRNAEPLDEPEATLAPAVESPLERALKTAVSAAAAAEAHGKAVGYAVRFSSNDIRALGITVLIGYQSGRAA